MFVLYVVLILPYLIAYWIPYCSCWLLMLHRCMYAPVLFSTCSVKHVGGRGSDHQPLNKLNWVLKQSTILATQIVWRMQVVSIIQKLLFITKVMIHNIWLECIEEAAEAADNQQPSFSNSFHVCLCPNLYDQILPIGLPHGFGTVRICNYSI